ncbi:MAG: hypothetical protein IPM54_21005 [Polyangiaceae bacterium]|nr:hypothetical protein [Polyangiaceae bacterium]
MESSRNKAKRTRITAAAIALGMASFVVAERPARAEGPVTGTGKGIAGLAIIGGSVTATTMGLVGVEQRWAYLVFPPLVAVGAGIGGYFMESAAPPEVSTYILGAGMALIIPTIIVSLNATVYKVPDEYPNDPSKRTPAKEPPRAGARVQESFRTGFVPRSLVDIHEGSLAVGLPPVQIRPAFTTEEMAKFGVAQTREVHVPLFHASF